MQKKGLEGDSTAISLGGADALRRLLRRDDGGHGISRRRVTRAMCSAQTFRSLGS